MTDYPDPDRGMAAWVHTHLSGAESALSEAHAKVKALKAVLDTAYHHNPDYGQAAKTLPYQELHKASRLLHQADWEIWNAVARVADLNGEGGG